jgi:hypothetical protein
MCVSPYKQRCGGETAAESTGDLLAGRQGGQSAAMSGRSEMSHGVSETCRCRCYPKSVMLLPAPATAAGIVSSKQQHVAVEPSSRDSSSTQASMRVVLLKKSGWQ